MWKMHASNVVAPQTPRKGGPKHRGGIVDKNSPSPENGGEYHLIFLVLGLLLGFGTTRPARELAFALEVTVLFM